MMKPQKELTAFQRNEALVLTDNSDTYAQWPKVTPKKHDVEHKMGSASVGKRAPVATVVAQPHPASRAPLVQQRAAVLRSSRASRDTTTTATAAATVKSQSPLRNKSDVTNSPQPSSTATNREEGQISRGHQQPPKESLAMTSLLQQAEELLSQVNSVRGYRQQKYPNQPSSSSQNIGISSRNAHSGGSTGDRNSFQSSGTPYSTALTKHSNEGYEGDYDHISDQQNQQNRQQYTPSSKGRTGSSSTGPERDDDRDSLSYESTRRYSGDMAALLQAVDSDRGNYSEGRDRSKQRSQIGPLGSGGQIESMGSTGPKGPASVLSVGAALTRGRDPTSTLTQLDWLLRGLPEAYDEGDCDMKGGPLDDLAIEKLIREGGMPPSQLAFPSLYAMGQQIMNKLQKARCLAITFNQIFVYSGRYGVRKHCSRLLIRPPRGCITPENEPEAIIIDLPELLGRGYESEPITADVPKKSFSRRSSVQSNGSGGVEVERGGDRNVRRRSSAGVGPEAFFVGGMELKRTVLFPLAEVTDKVLQSWRGGGGVGGEEGCVRIELQGHVVSPYVGIAANVSLFPC